uniref:Uncharacterized protein n=1 Tax=Globodera rostochiensis TaxID=31243 RepID=A0A914IBK8_GLORO
MANKRVALKNLYDFDERLRCYEQAFSHDEHLNPKITNSEWTIQFVKDVFESLGNPNAEQWCYNQFIKLFVDLNFDIGQVHYDKLCAWLLKDGLNIAKECIKNHSEIGPKAMEAWGIALKILGKQVLRSTETTNSCVSIFSLAIKSNNVLTIKEAYRAWKAIVTIFAKDPTWTSVEMPRDKSSRVNQSRLQLIMTALRYKKLPVEISSEVFDCWWTCCNSLGPRLVAEFEDIAHSFMRFCVGGSPNFLRSIAKFDSIFSEVSKQLEPTTHVFFVMNQKLEKSTYAQHKWNDNAHFKVRLIDLLESLLNEPGFCCFNDPQIVKDHSVFAVQCIRHCDQRCVDAADRDSLSERISNLMCAVLEKITTKLADDDCAAQQTLFLAQFDAWLKESTLPNETLLRTFKKLQIDSIVSQIVEKASTYGKYTDKLKESLNEWKNKQFDGRKKTLNSLCIRNPNDQLMLTKLAAAAPYEQQMNTCGYGEDGTTSGLEIDEQQKEWEDEKRTEKKEEERKQSQEGKEEAEKEEMEKEGKWTEETVSKGEETKVADKEENVEEELNEREDEEETRKSEEQETGKGGEEEEKEAEKEVEEEKKVEDNGDKEEEEKVEKEGKDEQETMKTGEEAEKEEKGEEGKKAELSMEETEKGEEDKEEALMEDVSGKEADALEEIWEANEIELVEEPTEDSNERDRERIATKNVEES